MGPYVDALCADIAAAAPGFADYEVITVFFGGGTPTMLTSAQLRRVLDAVRSNYRLAGNATISTEANPETVDYAYLVQLRQAGFNRLSFGVQSFDAHDLSLLGRVHSPEKAADTVHQADRAGFADINIDLIFALPHQSLSDFGRTLDAAIGLPITHVSCYGLTVEDGTPLSRDAVLLAALPDEAADRAMYYIAKEMLAAHGFEHYEISNWAKPGFVCCHNWGYWTHREYMGFGIGAHGFVKKRRVCKTNDPEAYIGGDFTVTLLEEVDMATEMAEFMILGLRTISGIDVKDFAKRFGRDVFDVFGVQIKKFKERGLLEVSGAKVALTSLGLDLSNMVLSEFTIYTDT